MAESRTAGSPSGIAEPGTQLGPYQIEAAIGRGGMGEVFRAVDTRLGRNVAIKILPRDQIADAERKKRFLQEARAASALNHSNIVTLHDIASDSGVDYLVMELVEGESLESIMRERLPVSEALSYAHQIAVGLAAAHAAGIVHRDIKPGNVIVTAESQVKILDFGLAKLTERVAGKDRQTLKKEAALTEVGTLMGTVAYMSPEQVGAKPLDGRTDIFSLGVMLQEMLTGVQPFRGESAVETMHAILHDPAPLLEAQPPELQEIVDRALAKEPKDRYQHVGDLALDLQRFQKASQAKALPSMRGAPAPVTRGMGSRILAGTAALGALATIGLGTLLIHQSRSAPPPELIRFEISPPVNATFVEPTQLAISPDGRNLAFIAADAAGTWLLWVRPLDTVVARPLPGTEGAGQPFWSPDSEWIGFFAQGKLKKVQAAGGLPEALADAPDGRKAAWSPEGVILFTPDLFSGLSRVSASGGQAAVTTVFAEGQGGFHPSFLPDGRRFVYWRAGSVYVGALDSSESQALFMNQGPAVYAEPGYLLFARQGELFAQRFDAATLALAGAPVRIADSLMPPAYVGTTFSVSHSGVLTYRTLVEEDRQFAWFDRTGRQIELVGAPGSYRGVDLSPDGGRIAVQRQDGRGGDIWVLEPRGTTTRLTFDARQDNSMPVWSPDGARIVFGSSRNGRWGVYRKASNGTGAEELLVESDLELGPMAWAPDGNSIVYSFVNGNADQWLLPLGGDRQPTPLLDSRSLEYHAQISPNGKWLAYASNDAGGYLVVYVKPFPSGDGKWQVSTSGGILPRWRADGKEIFYVTPAAPGKVVAVTVNESGPTMEVVTAQELFDSGLALTIEHSYAVSPDGQRFLIPRPVSSFRDGGVPPSSPISVVLNWTALLEADRR